MKKLSLSMLLFLFIHFAVAQNYKRIDSLKQALAIANEDTNKVLLYAELGFAYQWSLPDSSLLYSVPGLALSTKLNFIRGQLEVLLPVSEALSMKGNYSKALEFRFEALELARKTNDPQNIANALALIGAVYYYSKDYEKALIYYYKAIETYAVDLGGPEIIWGFIGEAYFQLNQFDSASLYIERTYNIDIKSKTFHWSTPYFYLGVIMKKKGISKRLWIFIEKALLSHQINWIL